MPGRSPFDPDTEFWLERSGTPVNVDGFKLGEPTGEVVCAECGAVARDMDDLAHPWWCPQFGVHSQFWHKKHETDPG